MLSLLFKPFRWVPRGIALLIQGLGVLLLACAFASLVVDASRTIANGELTMMSAGQTWYNIHRESINVTQAVIQRYTLPFFWDPVIQTILTWPVVPVLAVPGFILLISGRRRKRSGRQRT